MEYLLPLFFGSEPMSFREKVVGTLLSAVLLPTVSLFLLVTVLVLKVAILFGVVLSILGLVFAVYSTWYLWVKLPLKNMALID